MQEELSNAILKLFEELSPDLDDIYYKNRNRSIENVRSEAITKVMGSGAVSQIIPGLHLVAIVADFIYLLTKMTDVVYGIGASKLNSHFSENYLETEDFANVLAIWSGEKFEREKILANIKNGNFLNNGDLQKELNQIGIKKFSIISTGVFSVTLSHTTSNILLKGLSKSMLKVLAKVSGKMIGYGAGYVVGGKIAKKQGAKIAAKAGAKLGGKIGSGFIPLIGPMVGAGINSYFVNSISEAAEKYFEEKVKLIKSIEKEITIHLSNQNNIKSKSKNTNNFGIILFFVILLLGISLFFIF